MIKRTDNDKLIYQFLNSMTFTLWQMYCRIRDENKGSIYAKGEIKSIDRKILNSKTYKIWLKSYLFRNRIYVLLFIPPINLFKKYTPRKVKKIIKVLLHLVKNQFTRNIIDKNIMSDWLSYSKRRDGKHKDFMIFGIIAYNYRYQRPQQLAEQLSLAGHRVFYIDNNFIPQVIANSPKIKVIKIKENLFTVNLAATRELFIYKDKPSQKDKIVIKKSLKLLIKNARIINPIAKIDHPFWANLLDEIAMPVIYDCMDEHSGFKESSEKVITLERKLFKHAQLVLVSSEWLYKKAVRNNSNNILLLRNAAEYEHFSIASTLKLETPDDLINIKGPIIGYYGAISNWFDTDILENVAKNFKNASIVLIGRIDNEKVQKIAKKYKNIYLLGEKYYEELPAYLSRFDVATIPFILSNLIKATNPVKVYEYLSAGKPIVTTAIPELNPLNKYLYIAKNKADFIKNIEIALNEKKNKIFDRKNVSKMNTWNIRGRLLNKKIMEIFNPRVSVVIVSYNSEKYIRKCLSSILKLSYYSNLEIIVVDNKSNISTVNLLKRYQETNDIKLILNNRNLGFAAGNNKGIKLASGKYFILLNNDTIVTPGWVSRLIFHLNKKNTGLVGPVTVNIGNEAKINIEYEPEDYSDIESKALNYTSNHWGETIQVDRIAAFCWIMNRELWEKVGEFDERFGRGLFEDDDYCKRVLKAGYKILIADDVFIHHYGGGSTKWNTKKYQVLFEQNKKIFEEKWDTKWIPHKYRKGI